MGWLRRTGVVIAGALVILLVLASPAAAHAELQASDPASGATLDTSPDAITLEFSEPVEVALGGIRLFDADGSQVAVGGPEHPEGDASRVAVDVPDLAENTYVVSWSVTSADSHPVNGAFTFQVGSGPGAETGALVAELLAESGGGGAAKTGLTVSRAVGYAGIALFAGGLAAVALIWPEGAGRRGVRRMVTVGWVMALAGALAAFGLQGPYATGQGLGKAFDPDLWSAVADTRYGRATLLRIVVVAVGGLLVLTIGRRRSPIWRTGVVALVGGVGLGVALAGHATTERLAGLAVATHVGHVAAMAVWLGGLALLGLVALQGPSPVPAHEPEPETTPVAGAGEGGTATAVVDAPAPATTSTAAESGAPDLLRWSTVAGVCVAVLVITGLVQAWRLVESFDALVSTSYGRTLLIKTALVVVMVGLAAASRRALARREGRALRLLVRDELAFGVGILAVTAVLAGTPPARVQASEPYSVSLVENSLIADITIDPAQAATPSTMHIYLTPPGGTLQRVESIEVRFTLPERELGPIPVPVEPAGVNHWLAAGFVLPYEGQWRMEVVAQVTEFEQVRLAATVPIS